jgi:hypothetical protein
MSRLFTASVEELSVAAADCDELCEPIPGGSYASHPEARRARGRAPEWEVRVMVCSCGCPDGNEQDCHRRCHDREADNPPHAMPGGVRRRGVAMVKNPTIGTMRKPITRAQITRIASTG